VSVVYLVCRVEVEPAGQGVHFPFPFRLLEESVTAAFHPKKLGGHAQFSAFVRPTKFVCAAMIPPLGQAVHPAAQFKLFLASP
jgi:hypothetical protein